MKAFFLLIYSVVALFLSCHFDVYSRSIFKVSKFQKPGQLLLTCRRHHRAILLPKRFSPRQFPPVISSKNARNPYVPALHRLWHLVLTCHLPAGCTESLHLGPKYNLWAVIWIQNLRQTADFVSVDQELWKISQQTYLCALFFQSDSRLSGHGQNFVYNANCKAGYIAMPCFQMNCILLIWLHYSHTHTHTHTHIHTHTLTHTQIFITE